MKMPNEMEKSEQPSPEDVLSAIQSFNDPSIITNLFRELGWSYSLEIKETLTMAKQNANLSIKFKAIKHLRELLREAAEVAGYTANVSQTFPNAQGGQTTFHAKRISNILNPTKQIESIIKEPKNDKTEKSTDESNRGSDRREGQRPEGTGELHEGVSGGTDTRDTSESRPKNEIGTRHSDIRPESSIIEDTGRAFPAGDVESGGTEPPNGGETPRPVPRGGNSKHSEHIDESRRDENPCVKTRPPTCDRDLFPGVSSTED